MGYDGDAISEAEWDQADREYIEDMLDEGVSDDELFDMENEE